MLLHMNGTGKPGPGRKRDVNYRPARSGRGTGDKLSAGRAGGAGGGVRIRVGTDGIGRNLPMGGACLET